MPIDSYENSFKDLVENDLPRLLSTLEKDMEENRSLGDFGIKGVGERTLLKKLGWSHDISGCYVLSEDKKPVYVGISRSIVRRLRQHVCGTTHSNASLAYRIAREHMPHNETRDQAMKNEQFKLKFKDAKSYLRGLNVAFVNIDNPLVLYIFEPYCAMKYDTHKWNTFETH